MCSNKKPPKHKTNKYIIYLLCNVLMGNQIIKLWNIIYEKSKEVNIFFMLFKIKKYQVYQK